LPGAGKSRAIDILAKGQKWHLIRPSDWIPENLSTLDIETQRAYNIECWSMAIDKCKEAIVEVQPREIIVLDSCNSKFNTLRVLITEARQKLHKVVLLFIQSNSNLCLARDAKLTQSLLNDYVDRFKESLPKYKQACDSFSVVKNNGTLEQLEFELRTIWKKLCENI
jgi:hypothetical protein